MFNSGLPEMFETSRDEHLRLLALPQIRDSLNSYFEMTGYKLHTSVCLLPSFHWNILAPLNHGCSEKETFSATSFWILYKQLVRSITCFSPNNHE